MRNLTYRHMVVFAAVVLIGFLAARVQGQTITRQGSSVEAMFASESEAYQASDPAGIPFGLAGSGPYAPGAGIPTLPPAPAPSVTPPSGGNPFAGTGWTSYFNDNYSSYGLGDTRAVSTINDNIVSSPTKTSDISITLPIMWLKQYPSATGYAYDQLDFGSNYAFTSNPGLAASPTPNLPVFITGTVQPAITAYAQFDGVVDYTWIPVSGIPGTTTFTIGTPLPLGQLSWTFLQNGGGSFNQTLTSSGSLGAIPSGDGILALDGHMWLAGDPSEITVLSVPEPSTLVLLGIGAVSLLTYAWRRRARAS